MGQDWPSSFEIQINQSTLPYVVISMNFQLAVYTVFLIVTKENAPGFTKNKLTMRPYYMTLYYTAAFFVQMIFAVMIKNKTLYVLDIVNLAKLSF